MVQQQQGIVMEAGELRQLLSKISGTSVSISENTGPDGDGTASVFIKFSDSTKIRADYWRLILNERACLSSFDHLQKYGRPEKIDAKEQLISCFDNEICNSICLDEETGDLEVKFTENKRLQILNFTGYEVWEINFPNGRGEYSNYAVKPKID
jgi:hypothetical protein